MTRPADEAGSDAVDATGSDPWAGAWRMTFEIAWGDCDDAGIVFYPQFFRWMDTAFHRWLRSRGSSHRDITQRFGLVGLPIVEANAQFRSSISYDDELVVLVRIAEWQGRRFRAGYRGMRLDGSAVFDGHEVRALAARDPETGRLKGRDVTPEFKALLGG